MSFLIHFFYACFIISGILYACLITACIAGWLKTKNFLPAKSGWKTKVSIVISARNEEQNIGKCLTSLLCQDYPKELFEIIIADDASTDNTSREIEKVIQQTNKTVSLIRLKEDPEVISPKKKSPCRGYKKSIRNFDRNYRCRLHSRQAMAFHHRFFLRTTFS